MNKNLIKRESKNRNYWFICNIVLLKSWMISPSSMYRQANFYSVRKCCYLPRNAGTITAEGKRHPVANHVQEKENCKDCLPHFHLKSQDYFMICCNKRNSAVSALLFRNRMFYEIKSLHANQGYKLSSIQICSNYYWSTRCWAVLTWSLIIIVVSLYWPTAR